MSKKYTPDFEDLYETKLCPICGLDILDPKAETCSRFCDSQLQSFKDDYEQDLIDGLMKDLEKDGFLD